MMANALGATRRPVWSVRVPALNSSISLCRTRSSGLLPSTARTSWLSTSRLIPVSIFLRSICYADPSDDYTFAILPSEQGAQRAILRLPRSDAVDLGT